MILSVPRVARGGEGLWADRISKDVDQQLASKGLAMQPSGGDVRVSALGRVAERQSYTTFHDGIGGGGYVP